LDVVLGGVQHHVHHAVTVAIRRGQRADIHAETPGDGGSHLIGVEVFAAVCAVNRRAIRRMEAIWGRR
jgi:hypothetical protein